MPNDTKPRNTGKLFTHALSGLTVNKLATDIAWVSVSSCIVHNFHACYTRSATCVLVFQLPVPFNARQRTVGILRRTVVRRSSTINSRLGLELLRGLWHAPATLVFCLACHPLKIPFLLPSTKNFAFNLYS